MVGFLDDMTHIKPHLHPPTIHPPLEIIRPPLVEFYHPQSKLDCVEYMCRHNTSVHSTRPKEIDMMSHCHNGY